MSTAIRLRVYRFEAGVAFEGGLVSAVERLQLGGGAKLLDALAVMRDETGALDAVDLATAGVKASLSGLLDFRLDPARRRAITERTLAGHPGGVPRAGIEAIGAGLEPGGMALAVLHTGEDIGPLADAVERMGGRAVADEVVEDRTLGPLAPRLSAAVASG